MKYIQRKETKLSSPPLESFHGNFKTYACLFNSASKNYIQVPNSLKSCPCTSANTNRFGNPNIYTSRVPLVRKRFNDKNGTFQFLKLITIITK